MLSPHTEGLFTSDHITQYSMLGFQQKMIRHAKGKFIQEKSLNISKNSELGGI